MKLKCPSCGKIVSAAEGTSLRSVTCSCKHTFAIQDAEKVEEKASGAFGLSGSIVRETEAEMAEVEASGELSDTEIGRYLVSLQKSREEISFSERKKVEDQDQKKLLMTNQDIEMDERFAPKPKEEIPGPAPVDDTVLAAEKELKARSQAKAQAKKVGKVYSLPKAKTRGQSLDLQAFLRHKYLLITTGIVLATVVGGFGFWLTEEKKTVETADPYLTKLLTPTAKHDPVPEAKAAPAEAAPAAPAIAAETSPSQPSAAPSAAEDEEDTPTLLRKMREAALRGDSEHIIRLASGSAMELGEEERALLIEASLERAGKNKMRLREIYLKLSEERRNHPNASAFLRTQAAAMLLNPVTNKDLLTGLDILKSLSMTRPQDPLVYGYLGSTYEKLGRMELAHSNWEQALILAPSYVSVIEHRLQLYSQASNWEMASQLATRLSKIEGYAYKGYMKLAEIADKRGKKADSLAYYRKAVEIDNRADARLELGNSFRDQNKFDSALEQYRAGLKADATPEVKRELHLNIANLLCKMKKYEDAWVSFGGALRGTGSAGFRALYNRGLCEMEAGMNKKAVSTLQQGLKMNPNHADAYLAYGIALLRTKNPKAALDPLNRSIKMRPSDKSYYWLGTAYFQMGKKKEAKASLQSALKLNPKNKDASVLNSKIR